MMMPANKRALMLDLVFFFAGAVFTIAAIPLVASGFAELREMHDEANPPTRFKIAEYELKPPDTVRMRFEVTRLEDCDLLRVAAFSSRGPNDLLEPAITMRREDGSHVIPYPVGATYLSPWWLMQPVYGPRIRIYGYYDCANRLVRTKLIDEVLQ